MLGIIAGTVLPTTKLLPQGKERTIGTPHGRARITVSEDAAYIQRHGKGDIPPHMINHKANIWAMREYADTVIGVSSVGSLKRSIKPPTLLVPDDFLQFDTITYFDNEIRHITPSFDEKTRKEIIGVASWHKINVYAGGVYAQTRGPRFETKAEVGMLAHFADVVGMTAASEATLACELGIRYAAICSVDNLAHGLAKGRLDFKDVKDNATRNSARVEELLRLLIGEHK
ncbi:MAG: MTAP family purine nucleoside phosphorylase [Candidatus Altiarchaeota archaeon]